MCCRGQASCGCSGVGGPGLSHSPCSTILTSILCTAGWASPEMEAPRCTAESANSSRPCAETHTETFMDLGLGVCSYSYTLLHQDCIKTACCLGQVCRTSSNRAPSSQDGVVVLDGTPLSDKRLCLDREHSFCDASMSVYDSNTRETSVARVLTNQL